MDARSFFEKKLPQIPQERLANLSGRYQFQITGAGTWLVSINAGSLEIAEIESDADCTVICDADSFDQLSEGKIKPQMAFMSGKLKVYGNMNLAMDLSKLF